MSTSAMEPKLEESSIHEKVHSAPMATASRDAVDPKSFSNLVFFGDTSTCTVASHFAGKHASWPSMATRYAREQGFIKKRPTLVNNAMCFGMCDKNLVPTKTIDVLHGQMKRNTIQGLFGLRVALSGGKKKTLYGLWCGTSDVAYGFVEPGVAKPGATVEKIARAMTYTYVEKLYKRGGRFFVFTLGYLVDSLPDVKKRPQEFIDKLRGVMDEFMEYSERFIKEIAASNQFPGARFGILYAGKIQKAIYDNPSQYLSGASPNVMSSLKGENVKPSDKVQRENYLWFDGIHMGYGGFKIVAQEFAKGIYKNDSQFFTWLPSPSDLSPVEVAVSEKI